MAGAGGTGAGEGAWVVGGACGGSCPCAEAVGRGWVGSGTEGADENAGSDAGDESAGSDAAADSCFGSCGGAVEGAGGAGGTDGAEGADWADGAAWSAGTAVPSFSVLTARSPR
ncbi:hypothetical protein BU197_18640 [Streptomyces sp. CBMA291]|nr:hypothetical protein [Streptomyces sp. CBMA291]